MRQGTKFKTCSQARKREGQREIEREKNKEAQRQKHEDSKEVVEMGAKFEKTKKRKKRQQKQR